MTDKKSQDSLAKAIGKAVGKEGGYEALINLGEVAIDAITSDGVLREIPIICTLFGIGRAGLAARDVLLLRKLQAFLLEMRDIPEERERFAAEMDAAPDQRDKIGMHLLVLLDRFEEMEKAKLLGKAFKALLRRQVASDDFRRMARAIDRCMVDDLMLWVNDFELASKRPGLEVDLVSCGILVDAGIEAARRPGMRPFFRWTPFGQSFAKLVLLA